MPTPLRLPKQIRMDERLVMALAEEVGREIESLTELWRSEGNRGSDNRVRLLADCLSKVRHARCGLGPKEDEQEKLDWGEARWMLERLRPSLVLDGQITPEALADYLKQLELDGSDRPGEGWVIIAALDGAPEFRRYAFLAARNNGNHPEGKVEHKDAEFYRLCFHALTVYDVTSLREKGSSSPVRGVNSMEGSRCFQDAFVGWFHDQSAVSAVAAALHLHQVLAKYNEERSCNWTSRIHARIALGSNWAEAVQGLGQAWRGQTAVGADLFSQLGEGEQELANACGVRLASMMKQRGASFSRAMRKVARM